MGDITVTPTYVGLAFPMQAKIRSLIAAEAITKGQAVYITTAGKAGVADSNGSGTDEFRGIALGAAGAGQAVDVLQEGDIYGFDLSGVNADALVYLSNTAGALATTGTVAVGRVNCLADKSLTKVLSVAINRVADWT